MYRILGDEEELFILFFHQSQINSIKFSYPFGISLLIRYFLISTQAKRAIELIIPVVQVKKLIGLDIKTY